MNPTQEANLRAESPIRSVEAHTPQEREAEDVALRDPAMFDPPLKLYFDVGSNLHEALKIWSDAIRAPSIHDTWEKVKDIEGGGGVGIEKQDLCHAPDTLKARLQKGELHDVQNVSRLQRNRLNEYQT